MWTGFFCQVLGWSEQEIGWWIDKYIDGLNFKDGGVLYHELPEYYWVELDVFTPDGLRKLLSNIEYNELLFKLVNIINGTPVGVGGKDCDYKLIGDKISRMYFQDYEYELGKGAEEVLACLGQGKGR